MRRPPRQPESRILHKYCAGNVEASLQIREKEKACIPFAKTGRRSCGRTGRAGSDLRGAGSAAAFCRQRVEGDEQQEAQRNARREIQHGMLLHQHRGQDHQDPQDQENGTDA